MLTEDRLQELAEQFEEKFSAVSLRILRDIGETLKKTGDLTPAQAKKLQQMFTYGADIERMTKMLAQAAGESIDDIRKLYEQVAQEEQDWSKPFYDAKDITQIPLKENELLQNIIKSATAVTKGDLRNMSRTTVVGIKGKDGFQPLGSFYKKTVDGAITAVATGALDYNSVIRQAVKDMGSSGLRVRYEGGYTKRLDSAIRQNIIDGASYIAQETAKQAGEEFGADGVELSAHSPSAPDHLPYQGKQYSMKEFDELQKTLDRPIGEWNCRHFPYPILLGISRPANSKEELDEMQEESNRIIEIDGKEYTRYECTQIQRKLETKLRYAREEKAIYQAAGQDDLVREVTEKMRILGNKYKEVSDKAGLPTRAERLRVFRSRKTVEKTGKSGIIKSGAVSGARNPLSKEAREHAERYYGLVRSMKTDVSRIAKATGFSEEDILAVKSHIFLEKHDLGGKEPEYFVPDYMMAESWQRLVDGKPEHHDITLLNHEIMERELMESGMTQEEAHIETSAKYNYSKEAGEYYAKIKKYKNG